MSLLTIFRAPVHKLWKPAIVATEWGHWLVIISLGTGGTGFLIAGLRWSALASVIGAALFLSPVLRAFILASRLPARVGRVFDVAQDPHHKEQGYADRPQNVPLSVSRLVHLRISRVDRSTIVYKQTGAAQLTLDLYRGRGPGASDAPGVVLTIHGGSWNSGDNSQLTGMNRYLASRGFVVAALNYRLAPLHPFPAPVEDIRSCIEFLPSIGERFGFDPDKIVLLGRSSGGHLALSAAYDPMSPASTRVRGVIALYAPTDLRWSWRRPAPLRLMDSNAVIRQFLGGGPEDVQDLFDRASPIQHVSRDSPPTLLIHGGKDELVSPLQSRRLAAALYKAGAHHLHVELPWGCHGMDANLAGPSGQISLYLIERFLESVGISASERSG